MEPIRLIRDKAELQGTCYFELLPSKYQGQCWNDESVFLAEDVFRFVEPIIARHEEYFDHYSFVEILRPTWLKIIADLQRLAERAELAQNIDELRGEVSFLFASAKREFTQNFRSNAEALASLARELARWLLEHLRQHDCISVLGM
jgi:hypothetical protein